MSVPDLEATLLREAVGGDRAALSQLLLLHFDPLQRHVETRISQQLQGLVRAEDVMQQVFVRAATSIGTFESRHEGAFRGWLTTIADNLVRDAEKRRRRERRAWGWDAWKPSSDTNVVVAGEVDGIAGPHTSPSRRAGHVEVIRSMQSALAGLPAEQREMLRRRYLLGQSLDQIAEATGRTKSAVRGLCFRARRNLRAVMGRTSLYFSN